MIDLSLPFSDFYQISIADYSPELSFVHCLNYSTQINEFQLEQELISAGPTLKPQIHAQNDLQLLKSNSKETCASVCGENEGEESSNEKSSPKIGSQITACSNGKQYKEKHKSENQNYVKLELNKENARSDVVIKTFLRSIR